MSEIMTFPDTCEEYEAYYGFTDREQIYTNMTIIGATDGARLIPSFRVKHWLDNIAEERKKGKWIPSDVPESTLLKCDQCGWDLGAYCFNYCPICGADMRGMEQEGEG